MSESEKTIQEQCYGTCWGAQQRIDELTQQLNAANERIKRLEDAYAAKDKQLSNLLHICRDNDIEVSSYDLIHGRAKP